MDFEWILINSGTWGGYSWRRLSSGGIPASSESKITLARANSASLCAFQPYNYIENNPRPRSSRGSRAGALEISKISKNPRFSSFRLPRAPTAPLGPIWLQTSGFGPQPRDFVNARSKNTESAPGAREKHRRVPLTSLPLRRNHTRAAGPAQAAPGGPQRSPEPDPPNCDTLGTTMAGPT